MQRHHKQLIAVLVPSCLAMLGVIALIDRGCEAITSPHDYNADIRYAKKLADDACCGEDAGSPCKTCRELNARLVDASAGSGCGNTCTHVHLDLDTKVGPVHCDYTMPPVVIEGVSGNIQGGCPDFEELDMHRRAAHARAAQEAWEAQFADAAADASPRDAH
jgi:hypothetical protein